MCNRGDAHIEIRDLQHVSRDFSQVSWASMSNRSSASSSDPTGTVIANVRGLVGEVSRRVVSDLSNASLKHRFTSCVFAIAHKSKDICCSCSVLCSLFCSDGVGERGSAGGGGGGGGGDGGGGAGVRAAESDAIVVVGVVWIAVANLSGLAVTIVVRDGLVTMPCSTRKHMLPQTSPKAVKEDR